MPRLHFLRTVGGLAQDCGGEKSWTIHSDKYLPHATWPGITEPPSRYAGKVRVTVLRVFRRICLAFGSPPMPSFIVIKIQLPLECPFPVMRVGYWESMGKLLCFQKEEWGPFYNSGFILWKFHMMCFDHFPLLRPQLLQGPAHPSHSALSFLKPMKSRVCCPNCLGVWLE